MRYASRNGDALAWRDGLAFDESLESLAVLPASGGSERSETKSKSRVHGHGGERRAPAHTQRAAGGSGRTE